MDKDMKTSLFIGFAAVVGLGTINEPSAPVQKAPTADQCMDELVRAAKYLPVSATGGGIDLSSSPEAVAVDNKYNRCMNQAAMALRHS